MKPARVKAAVVVAVTAVEGADVRAEGEAVTGEVVAEVATNNNTKESGGSAFCQLAGHRQQQLPVSFLGVAQGSAHLHQKSGVRSIEAPQTTVRLNRLWRGRWVLSLVENLIERYVQRTRPFLKRTNARNSVAVLDP